MSDRSQLQDPQGDVHRAMWRIHKAAWSRPSRELPRAEDRILQSPPTDSQTIRTDLWPQAISPPDFPRSEAAHTASRTPEIETLSPWTRSRDAPTMNENRIGTADPLPQGHRPQTERGIDTPRPSGPAFRGGPRRTPPIYMSGYVFCPNSRVSAKLSKLPKIVYAQGNGPCRPLSKAPHAQGTLAGQSLTGTIRRRHSPHQIPHARAQRYSSPTPDFNLDRALFTSNAFRAHRRPRSILLTPPITPLCPQHPQKIHP
jgi:hypothetical protein